MTVWAADGCQLGVLCKTKDLTSPLANLEIFDMNSHGGWQTRLRRRTTATRDLFDYWIWKQYPSSPRRCLFQLLTTTTTSWLHSTRTIQVGTTSVVCSGFNAILAIKRIMQEARELANDPCTDYSAAPLEVGFFSIRL